jgi:hypothetical protein
VTNKKAPSETVDYERLADITNTYWHEFSALVNRTLEKVNPEHHEYLKMMLQDHSSVYGRDDKA